jgi:uncharacterized protein YoxC
LERIECGAWKGEAAKAFAGHVSGDLTPLVKKSHQSFDKAAHALHNWAHQLQGFQDEADRLEKKTGHKLKDLDDAKSKKKGAGDASTAVNDVMGEVTDLQNRYNTAAALIGKQLDKAGNIAPDAPGMWHRLTHAVEGVLDNGVQWVEDHADDIAEIGDALSTLSSALGVLAIVTAPFEPIGAIFATAILIASGAALMTHLTAKAAGADVSWFSIAGDAMGVIPGIKGFVSGTAELADGVNAGVRATKLGEGFAEDVATGKKFILFGPDKEGSVVKLTEGGGRLQLGNRLKLAVENNWQNNQMGQWMGTRTMNELMKSSEFIPAMSVGGRSFDAAVKYEKLVHKTKKFEEKYG